jgi:hypothetical protein
VLDDVAPHSLAGPTSGRLVSMVAAAKNFVYGRNCKLKA